MRLIKHLLRVSDRLVGRSVFMLLVTLCMTVSYAQDAQWPQRPVRVIVPFKAGGGSDT